MDSVLIVENDDGLRELYTLILQDAGFDVRCASDGKAGLDLLVDGLRPRALILDLCMPVMDGRTFLSTLARLPRPVRSTPVLVVTGMAHVALPEGVTLLRKPFESAQLEDALRTLLAPHPMHA